MKRIRIGKDISMRWEITTGGVAIPLEGRDLTVEIKSPMGVVSGIPYVVSGNTLIITYYGTEQKRVGEYSVTLWENKGKTGQNVVDVIRAFELVRTSQEEDDFVGGDLQIESVDLGTENFDILTEGGYRGINIDTLQAEALEDSVNINGKTYSNESFTITLPKANLDSAGVMSAEDKQTLQEHGDSIAQMKTSCEENAADIERVSNVVDAHESRLGGIDTAVSALQSKVDENTTSISQINSTLAEHTESISQINNTISDHGNSISQLESTTREHSNAISQINSKLDEHTESISKINNTLAEHTESINAKITTERIQDGAVTSEKIATSAFDSTLSVSGKIAPADVVGGKFTELGDEVDDVTKRIGYPIISGKYIIKENGSWSSNEMDTHLVVEIGGGITIGILTSKSLDCKYAFLKSYDGNATAPDFATGSSVTRLDAAIHTIQEITSPSDAKYLYVTLNESVSGNRTPRKILISSYNILLSVVDNFEPINDRIDNVTSDVSVLQNDVAAIDVKSFASRQYDFQFLSVYVKVNGYVLSSSSSKTTQPFVLHKGETIEVKTANNNISVISSTTKDVVSVGNTLTPLVTSSSSAYGTFSYTTTEDIKIVVCVLASNYEITIKRNNSLESRIDAIEASDTHTITSNVITIDTRKAFINEVSSDESVIIVGHNLFDQSTIMAGKIKNDSGVEVNDNSSSYFAHFIPVAKGKSLVINTEIQRVYYYDADKNFLSRTSRNVTKVINVPHVYNGTEVAFIQVQMRKELSTRDIMVVYGTGEANYEPFVSNTSGEYYPVSNIYTEHLHPVTINFSSNKLKVSPAFVFPSVYEPNSVDTGYSTPRPKKQTLRSLWTATNKYLYYQFISHYYDTYVGWYDDGYKVSKKSLGNDSSRLGYEVMQYVFEPKEYSKTVLLSAGMNSNETSTIWGVATFIRELMNGTDSPMRFLRNNVRFVVIPIICPSCFDQEPLKYENYNGVRINKNFNYIDSWANFDETQKKGEYPDSEVETRILKDWINEFAGKADLWIDCHSDPSPTSTKPVGTDWVTNIIMSDASLTGKMTKAAEAVRTFYVSKGYCTDSAHITINPTTTAYPKTRYSFEFCRIHALMIEQPLFSSAYGSDGNTNNDSYGIKNYVTMLRQYIYAVLECDAEIVE